MFVRNRMTKDPVTVTENVPVLEAGEIMRRNGFSRLPVVRDGRLVGIVTEMDIMRVSPSPATTLSVFEMNYLLSKLAVKDVMTKNPKTIAPEATLEEAAVLMRDYKIGALPVVENGRLVGIITESDIFDAFISLMGLREASSRITLEIEDRVGVLAEITQLIKERGINIITMATFTPAREGERGQLVLRLDTQEPDPLVEDFTARGFRVVHVARWKEKKG
ncbi:MAG: CBS and ACT domain-containing protein [Firmicutes bacterium]|mgnify:CR=1 FL=1|nr:CBS and ACT domain-containing protein [Bacillota bacterium]